MVDFLVINGIIINIISAFTCAYIADQKGKESLLWPIAGILLGPFGIIIALVSKQVKPCSNEKMCPYCFEFIKEQSIVCKYCSRDLPTNTDNSFKSDSEKNKFDSEKNRFEEVEYKREKNKNFLIGIATVIFGVIITVLVKYIVEKF